jgi:hypothetical protein
MPEVSRFLGIVVRMFFAENGHHLPHFHASYNDFSAVFLIEPLDPHSASGLFLLRFLDF